LKRIILVLIGLVPLLAFGYWFNHLLMTVFFYTVPPLALIGVAVLVIWAGFGMISKPLVASKRLAMVLLNAPAFVVLLLIIIQEVILGRMWSGHIGFSTQMFYLSLLRLGSAVGSILPIPFLSISIISAIAFLLMVVASLLGRHAAERVGTVRSW